MFCLFLCIVTPLNYSVEEAEILVKQRRKVLLYGFTLQLQDS